ncbi:MAG: trigger factor [Pseudomonadota bacterium]
MSEIQVSIEQPSKLKRLLKVEVPEAQIADEVKTRVAKLAKTARIDGFRQGKAPLKVIERRFGPRLREEVVGEVLQKSLTDAITDESLRPADQPVIDSVKADPGGGLEYTAQFEVFPEIELKPLAELKVEKATCEISEQDIDQMIEKLREQNIDYLDVERAAAASDQVDIDFEGFVEGEPFEGNQAEGFKLTLGESTMIDGFEDGLMGATAGAELELNLNFPEGYRNEALAGKPALFKIKVNSVAEPKLPEIDEALFEKFGVQEGGLEAFRDEVRNNVERERDTTVSQRFKASVLDALVAANEVDLPDSMVTAEQERVQQQALQELQMRGLDPSQAPAFDPDLVRGQAEQRVKLGLLMAEIMQKSELKPDPEQVRAKIESLAEGYEDSEQVVNWYYQQPQQLQQIEAVCLEEQAVNWIAEQADLTEVNLSFDDLIQQGQTDTDAGDEPTDGE